MGLLRSRRFVLLVAGTSLDAIGSWCALIALWAYASQRYGVGAGGIAMLGLAWSAPGAVLGPFAGVPIDRWGPKRVILAGDVLAAGAALLMVQAHGFGQLVALAGVNGVAKAFQVPAANALPPRLVDDEQLVAANALLGAADDASILFGPLLAAGTIAVAGFRAAFVVDAATYVIGALAVLAVPLRELPVRGVTRPWDDLVEGFRLARAPGRVRWTILLSMVCYLSWGFFAVLEPLYVRDVLERGPSTLAFLQVPFGIGLVITGLVISRMGDRAATPRSLAWAVALSGVAAALYVGTPWIGVAVIGVALWGVDVAFFAAPSRTLLQRHAPAEAHGRVLALNATAEGVAHVIAIPIAALSVGALGVRGTALAIGLVVSVGGVVALLRERRNPGPDDVLTRASVVVETGVDPVTSRFSGARSAD